VTLGLHLYLMITVVGAGKVGSSAAFSILERRIADVVLVDVAGDRAYGEALDMMQAAPAIEFDGKITGTNDYSKMAGSELVIVVAGQARQPGMTRMDLVNNNARTVRSIVKEVVKYAPACKLMMVTNPVDVMTYVACKESGFERNRVFGMGNILDTLRFRSYLAVELGDSMVPLVNFASVSGIPVSSLLTKDQIEKIISLTKTSGAEVIKLKGSTVYAPAAVIAIMADAVLRGRNRVMSVSTLLKGEYGLSDISIGVPCVLGRNGIERIIELELDSEAMLTFKQSASYVQEAITDMGV